MQEFVRSTDTVHAIQVVPETDPNLESLVAHLRDTIPYEQAQAAADTEASQQGSSYTGSAIPASISVGYSQTTDTYRIRIPINPYYLTVRSGDWILRQRRYERKAATGDIEACYVFDVMPDSLFKWLFKAASE